MRGKKGTKSGDIALEKWRDTMKKKHGENWREIMREQGRKGGSVSTPTGGFGAVDKHGRHTAAQIAGAKGGKKSRRGKTADRFIVAWTDTNGTAQTRKFKYAPPAQKFADNVNSVVLELPKNDGADA